MTKRFLFGVLSAALLCSGAHADIYHVSANTSSLSGTAGSLDMNFNPGPLSSQSSTVRILNVLTDGTFAASAATAGNVTGTLPGGTLTFTNGSAFNDYFSAFTFGSNLAFDVDLSGAALSSPDGVSTSGSMFAFSLFSDLAGTIPALTTDSVNGFGYTVTVNLNGTTTPMNYLTSAPVATTPEPGGIVLATTGILMVLLSLYVRRLHSTQGQPA